MHHAGLTAGRHQAVLLGVKETTMGAEAMSMASSSSRPGRRTTLEESRALRPWLTGLTKVLVGVFTFLALLCVPFVVVEPVMLVAAGSFAAIAGAFLFAERFAAMSTTPAERNQLEQRVREREAERHGRRSHPD
jgi:hypothetical protein